MPLVNVVWVLSKQHAVQQERPAGDQLLKPSQAQLQVDILYGREISLSVQEFIITQKLIVQA